MNIISCSHGAHAAAILEIFNEAIATSTALYDYHPRPLESMAAWFRAKEAGNFPVLGAVDEAGVLLGFATYGTFRERPANKYTVEHSVYVHRDHRGQGVGYRLMRRLLDVAREQGYHLLVGGIDAENRESRLFHERLGFTHAGTISQAGFKFGRWLDLAFYQLLLETPANPVDG